MSDDLADILGRFVQRSRYSRGQLSELSGVPKRTIANWLEGRVTKPQQWQPLLKVAAALHLAEAEATTLLQAASHPTLIDLRACITAEADQALLTPWPISRAPFQAIADLPYFVGREHELAHLRKTLLSGGFVTICNVWGMGGVGKTSLAAHLAYQLRRDFPDGVLWARLDTTDTLSILSAFAAAYDHDVSGYTDLDSRSSAVRALLADKRVLIVLDNAQTSTQVRPLLPPTTGKPAVIITTRHDLEIADHMDRLALDPFERESGEALTLFARILGERRARQFRSELLQIAEVLGHLPLALALVASRLALIPDRLARDFLEQIQRADQRLDELAREDRSVRLSFDASYEALPRDLQQFFITLSAFGGEDFGTEAIAYVAETSVDSAADQLDRLVRLSLVQPSRSDRYRLHPLLRDYAREKLTSDEAYLRVLDFFAAAIEALGSTDYHSLELDTDNILSALDAMHQRRLLSQFVRGVITFSDFLQARGLYALLDAHLAHAEEAAIVVQDRHVLTKVWLQMGRLKMEQGDLSRAQSIFQEGLSLAREMGDKACECESLRELGRLHFYIGEEKESRRYAEESLAIAREINDPVAILKCVGNLGVCVAKLGDYPLAEAHFHSSLMLAQQMGRYESEITMLQNLAWLAWHRHDYEQADAFSLDAAALARSTGRREALIGVLGNHSQSYFARGDVAQAEVLMQEALNIAREISHQRSIPDMLADLGQYAFQAGDFDRAADYWRESLQRAHQTGNLGLVSRVLTHQAAQQLACGQLGEAETTAQAALSQARQIHNQEHMADALFILAQVALARADTLEAATYGHDSLALMESANPRRACEIKDWLDNAHIAS
jgi:tetratricopeptide (TPR) repeat protein/transcriptional regulator with XRE-family HTH domain